MITAGLVILFDAGVTVAWGEPISAIRAALAQDEAEAELDRLESRVASRGAAGPAGQRDAASLRKVQRLTSRGDALGRIRITSIAVEKVVVLGADTESLRSGPGFYPRTSLPGEQGTVAIAGHRTTYGAPFRQIDELGAGDEIVVEMPYGSFTYRFERSRIVEPGQTGVVRDVGHKRLVLTACNPLYSTSQRYVVFARLVEGGP
jgi:sortase A